jgi:hypothetical protein
MRIKNISNKIQYIFFVFILGIACSPVLATAGGDKLVGVVKNERKVFKLFDDSGAVLENQHFANTLPNFNQYDYSVSDISSTTGEEFITFDENDTRRLLIYSQAGNEIDSLRIFNEHSRNVSLTTGDISDDYEGDEIIVCKKRATKPRLQVLSYSDEGGKTKLFGFQPFNNSSWDRGCLDLAIGDIDGDGENEIVIVRYDQKDTRSGYRLKIFSNTGDVEYSFFLPTNIRNINSVFAQDIDGDGTAEIIFEDNSRYVYAYDNEGSQLYVSNSYEYNQKDIKKIDVADIDGDGVAEVVVQQVGKKVPILILNSEGEVETHYNLYPNATHNTARFIFLGNFSTAL